MRKSMLTEKIPQDWRDANVASIDKKGNSREPRKYRLTYMYNNVQANEEDNQEYYDEAPG